MDTIITTAVTPIAIMLLFVYVFGGAIETGTDNYVNYLLPGILLIAIASGIAYTAVRLFTDLQSGIFERFHSMPIARSSVLWAHVLTSLAFRIYGRDHRAGGPSSWGSAPRRACSPGWPSPGSWPCSRWRSPGSPSSPALSAKSVDGAAGFSYPLIFLPFISSAFVPTDTMPAPVRVFAENQPVTSIVDAIQSLFAGQPVGSDIWVALAWCVGILARRLLLRHEGIYRRKIG